MRDYEEMGRGFVIAGTHSGVGKTTVATGVMAAFRRRGYSVQPFKAGPDYIDPSYHAVACGMPSRNLDTWLLEEPALLEFSSRAMRGKDLAVVEGVMGLYDGFHGEREEGSSAHLAKLLGLPVVLVVDASAAARSVGATVLGFKHFDPAVRIAGVVLNGIAGERHLEFIRPSLAQAGVPLLGYLPRNHDLALPQRHLGLVPTVEDAVPQEFYERLAAQVEQTVDLNRLLDMAAPVREPPSGPPQVFPPTSRPVQVAIAIAQDKAFSFYYPDSLDLLQAWGAELVPFSPLEDGELPTGISGVYIGGGFPELYAQGLSENAHMVGSLREAARSGLPVYAECGGLMYLGRSLRDQEGHAYPMAGVVPARSTLQGTGLTVGYRIVSPMADTCLLLAGDQVRGHEFHLSSLEEEPGLPGGVYRVLDQPARLEGFRVANVVASYIHLHFGSKKDLAPRFVKACVQWRSRLGEAFA